VCTDFHFLRPVVTHIGKNTAVPLWIYLKYITWNRWSRPKYL